MAPVIHEWSDMAEDFRDTLVLGNGASIAIHDHFQYPSLLQKARDEGLITKRLAAVFQKMKTEDFELALRYMSIAEFVNEALGIEDGETQEAYKDIRNALIRTVRKVHPEHEPIKHHLKPAYQFMTRFRTVLSLNYDLLVYWAMMLGTRKPAMATQSPSRTAL